MGAYVYMLRCADGSFYIGSATGDDLSVRVDQHNAGTYPGYTFKRRPVVLVWSEHRITDAIAAERQIKGWGRGQEGSANTVGLDGGQPTISASRRPREAELNDSSFEARKSSHLQR